MTQEVLLPEPDPDKWVTVEGAGNVRVNKLWEDPTTGASISLIEVPAGAGVPGRHTHASNQFMYCLEGEYEYSEPAPGMVLRPGSFYWNPKDNEHGPTRAITDCRLLQIHDGFHYYERPDYHSEESAASASSISPEGS
jgi:2,4'-dihydroxyacetophenone dioxygenase